MAAEDKSEFYRVWVSLSSVSGIFFWLGVKRRRQWTQESMVAGVRAVAEGMGLREASRLYNLPIETLKRRTTGQIPLEAKPGPTTVLTEEEESKLYEYCIKMADMGFGLSQEDLRHISFRIVEASGRKHPFTNEMAGRAWYSGFVARHPRLTLRTPQPLSFARAISASDEVVKDFFSKVGSVYARLNLLSKPMQIYNVDETGVSVVHKPGKVLTEIGRRNVWAVTSAKKGKTHTILACVSASGLVIPPLMVYPRKRMADHLTSGCVPGTMFQCSDNGWITSELFLKWFKENIPPSRPVLLIMDGHASHIAIEVIELAKRNDVHLLCLPAHTTHILQPLDVGVFKSFKLYYSKAVRRYLADNPGRVVTSDVIASLVGKTWTQAMTTVNIMSGFKKCGIFPLNPGEVTDRQMAPSTVWHAEVKAITPAPSDTSDSSVVSPEVLTTTPASSDNCVFLARECTIRQGERSLYRYEFWSQLSYLRYCKLWCNWGK